MIHGLKIEEGVPFILNEKTNCWAPASAASLPEMEELLRKMEKFDYPSVTKRENIILEKVFDIGTGKVRSFQDEDGDLTVMFQNESKNLDIIDEDMAFGLTGDVLKDVKEGPAEQGHTLIDQQSLISKTQNLMHSPSKTGLRALKKIVESQYEGIKKADGIDEKLKKRKISRDEVKETDELNLGTNKKRTAKKSVPLVVTEQVIKLFKKRAPSKTVLTEKAKVRRELNTLFLRVISCKGNLKGTQKMKVSKKAASRVSYLAKNVKIGNSVFTRNIIRFNKVNGVKGGIEERFYLIPVNETGNVLLNDRQNGKLSL